MPDQSTRKPQPQTTRSCQQCGQSFKAKVSRDAEGRGKFCSKECFYASTGIQRTCDHCGSSFKVPPSIIKRGENHGRFCSSTCRYAHRRVERTCKQCGVAFEVRKSTVKDERGGHYCSMACRAASFIGSGNPSWTGGSKENQGGYIELRYHDRRIREHRLVMERHIGRPLRTDEHVHHINHDRKDNRIENLMLLSKNEHAQLHGNERRRNPKGQYD